MLPAVNATIENTFQNLLLEKHKFAPWFPRSSRLPSGTSFRSIKKHCHFHPHGERQHVRLVFEL
jgi:hypothetical protein